jgi:FHS family L-fucose permease-like MFS transporter
MKTGSERSTLPAIVLTIGLFVVWGFSHRLYDTLVPEFAKVFGLSNVGLVLAQSVYSIIYFLLAIPAALYARAFGFRAAIVFGLGCYGVGAFLFYPAAEQHAFPFFWIAAAIMSSGWIFIEVAANPLIAVAGKFGNFTQRLNLAQAFYPVGVLIGVYVGRWLILSDMTLPAARLADAVVRPYIVIGAGVLLLAFVIDNVAFPKIALEHSRRDSSASKEIRTLLLRPLFMAGVVAQFFYVAAQVGAWTMTVRYVENAFPGISEASAADFLLWSLIAYGVGRFVGTALMSWIDPDRLLAIFAVAGIVAGALATGASGVPGVIGLVAVSFFMSIMFPTILAGAIRDLGPLIKSGTALVYMGGVGGFAGLAFMHFAWTLSSIQFAMIVPTLCFVVVLSFALANGRAAAAHRLAAARAE